MRKQYHPFPSDRQTTRSSGQKTTLSWKPWCGQSPPSSGRNREGFYAGTSKPVNHRLFNIFITCDFAEQSGHGIPQIVKAYGKEVFSFRDGMLIVTLPFRYEPDYVKARANRNAVKNQLTENQKSVLAFLSDHPDTSLQETAAACSLSIGGVKKIVSKLQEQGLLKREGAKNRSRWIIL